jgi:hypothetical protein
VACGAGVDRQGITMQKRFGYIVLGSGLFLIFFSISVDYLGIGKGGIQAAQWLGIQIGVIITLVGFGFISLKNDRIYSRANLKGLIDRIQTLPPIVWLILGIMVAYVLFFIFPVFLNDTHRIKYFNRFLPDTSPIGFDLRVYIDRVKNWLLTGESPYELEGFIYPPLFAVVFAPMALIDYPASYYLISTITLLSFWGQMLFAHFASKNRDLSISVFFLLTTSLSYGMQFELERGQFNLFAFSLALLAIYLYHHYDSFRYLAYVLFSVAAHLKVYPAFFIFMFIKDWKDWKGNIKRFLILGLLNIALLFVLGYRIFLDFVDNIPEFMSVTMTFPGNHSITSFVSNLAKSGIGLLSPDTQAWVSIHTSEVEILLIAYYMLCFLLILFTSYRREEKGINANLLLTCTIGSMVIPAQSVDYKLPMLAAPLALVLSNHQPGTGWLRNLVSILAVFLSALAYSITLIPYIYRPVALQISTPLLLMILTAVVAMNLVGGKKHPYDGTSDEIIPR